MENMATKEMNDIITRGIRGTPLVYKFSFKPEKVLYINGKDYKIFTGPFLYENPLFNIKWSIKIRDWIFTLERMTEDGIRHLTSSGMSYSQFDIWYVCGFHEGFHHNFGRLKNPSQTEYIEHILLTFFAVLHPEIKDSFTDLAPGTKGGHLSYRLTSIPETELTTILKK